jgi:hypothetical protein
VRLSSRPSRLLGGLVATVALLAACGGQDTSPDRLSPEAAVRAAAATSSEAGSSRFELAVTTELSGQSISFSGSGVLDAATGKSASTFELPGGGGTLEQRIVDGQMYLTVPTQPGFFQIALADLVGTQLESAADPAGALDALEGLSGAVEEVGSEQVRGEPTTHYRGTLDPAVALEKMGGALLDAAGPALADVEALPFEVWIDDDGRLRRFTVTAELPASPQTGGVPVTSTTTLELYDFGADVQVEAPPADEVRDGTPILEVLRGVAPVG